VPTWSPRQFAVKCYFLFVIELDPVSLKKIKLSISHLKISPFVRFKVRLTFVALLQAFAITSAKVYPPWPQELKVICLQHLQTSNSF